MTVPSFPAMSATFRDVSPHYQYSPYTPSWWVYSYVTAVPENAMGWMSAQGWEVTGSQTNDGVTTYNLARKGMQSWVILQTLLDSYTNAYNEGRSHNSIRYNDVVTHWANLLNSQRTYLNTIGDTSDGHVSIYLTKMQELETEMDAEMATAKTAMSDAGNAMTTQLAAILTKLDDLETNYTTHLATIGTLLTDVSSDLDTFLGVHEAKITELETGLTGHIATVNAREQTALDDFSGFETVLGAQLELLKSEYDTHLTDQDGVVSNLEVNLTTQTAAVESLLTSMLSDYTAIESSLLGLISEAEGYFGTHKATVEAILALLVTDYTSHATTASGYLTDLGVTDLARINEQFDNLQAKLEFELVNRGLSSSSLITSITSRVERERSEAITKLNDQLAREKLANEHQLFEQKDRMRARSIDGYSQLHRTQQEVLRYEAETLTRLYQQLQDVRQRTLGGKSQVYATQAALAEFKGGLQGVVYGQLRDVRLRTMQGREYLFQLENGITQWRKGNADGLFQALDVVASKSADSIAQRHASQQQATSTLMQQRDRLLGQFDETKKGVVAGKSNYNQQQLARGEFLVNARHRLALAVMQAQMERANARLGVRDREEKLMAYQLDSRNNLAVGLFGFVERREDEYPNMGELTRLVAGLGDSGGAWVSP